MQKNDEIFKDSIQAAGFTLLGLLFFSGDIKKSSEKKALKMTSHLVIFRTFSLFSSPDPKSEKNPVNQLLVIKILALVW